MLLYLTQTEVQISISTHSGAGCPFYRKTKQYKGTRQLFEFDWRDDPRKDEEWYEEKCRQLDPAIVAQEIDRNPFAAQGNSFLPSDWVSSAIDAHKRLNWKPEGIRIISFDPADEGGDPKAVIGRHGNVITLASILKQGDINDAFDWGYIHAEEYNADIFIYDAECMGAPAMKIWMQNKSPNVFIQPYYGGGEVQDKRSKYGIESDFDEVVLNREQQSTDSSGLQRNQERFANLRAQSFMKFRDRLRKTHEAVIREKQGKPPLMVSTSQMISIDSECGDLLELQAELSMPTRQVGMKGKIKVESKKEMRSRGLSSPGLCDCATMTESARHPDNRLSRRRIRRRPTSRYDFQISDSDIGY